MRHRSNQSFIVLFLVIILSSITYGQTCKQKNLVEFEKNGYKINDIKVRTKNRTLFNFEGKALNKILKALLTERNIDLKKGKVVKQELVKKATYFLRREISDLINTSKDKIHVPFVLTDVNCNDDKKLVDITFYIELFNQDAYDDQKNETDEKETDIGTQKASETDDIKDQEKLSDEILVRSKKLYVKAQEDLKKIENSKEFQKIAKAKKIVDKSFKVYRGVKKAYKIIKFINNFRVFPYATDTATGSISFGITANIKVFPSNPVLKRFVSKTSGGFGNSETAMYFKGDRSTKLDILHKNQWSFGYIYDRNSIIENDVRLINANRQRYFFNYTGRTKKYGKSNLEIKYGYQFAKTNQLQGGASDGVTLIENANPTTGNSNIKYDSHKLGLGTRFRIKHTAVTANYGIQFARGTSTQMDDYNKHVLNIETSTKLPQKFRFDANYGYGKITSSGNGFVPIRERFYGVSNYDAFFISGWRLTENPTIRSLQKADFASTDGSNFFGGDQFSGIRTTSYIPIWHKSPFRDARAKINEKVRELNNDFINAEKEEFKKANQRLKSLYLDSQPAVTKFKSKITDIKNNLAQITKHIGTIESGIKDSKLKERFKNFKNLKLARIQLELDELKNVFRNNNDLRQTFGLIDKNLKEILMDLGEFSKIRPPEGTAKKLVVILQQTLLDQANLLKKSVERLKEEYKELAIYVKKTLAPNVIKTVTSPRKLYKYLVRKTDAVFVDGILYLDIAKLRQKNNSTPWKTGLGGGIKFHYFFLDITSGYIWNLKRRSFEDRGKFIFKVNFSGLFR